jgi:hypothetical protein
MKWQSFPRILIACLALAVAAGVSLAPISEAWAQCSGACGGAGATGECYCDDACFEYGDCCTDVCTACPTLSGCGGGNPTGGCSGACGNQSSGGCYCDDACFDNGDCCTDVCTACPTLSGCGSQSGDCKGPSTPSGSSCGALTEVGCCDAQGRVTYCEGGMFYCIDCASQQPSCGWNAEANFYDCGTAGAADPSGANPKSCSGGGPAPVCGNGACESGETQQDCPTDCKSGTTCGNGLCDQGESVSSCPADCTDACAGKECGPDGKGGQCGTCPPNYFCSYVGECVSNDCEAKCEGKTCGEDGCGGSCGLCQSGEQCNAAGQCVESGTGEIPDDCEPNCANKTCGNDGCGGTCPPGCPEGYGCTPAGLCDQGYEDPEDPGNGKDEFDCAEGQVLYYGKCITPGAMEDEEDDGGCSAASSHAGAAWAGAALLLVLLAALRRRSSRA